MGREKAEVVRRLFDAVARGDDEEVLALYDGDVEWDGSRSRWFEVLSGDPVWRGHEGLREFFRGYYETWENLEHEIEEVLDLGGDRLVVVITARGRGRASGAEVEWRGPRRALHDPRRADRARRVVHDAGGGDGGGR